MGAKFTKLFHKKKPDDVVWLEPKRAPNSTPGRLDSFQQSSFMWDMNLQDAKGNLLDPELSASSGSERSVKVMKPERAYSVMSASEPSKGPSNSSSSSSSNENLEESALKPSALSQLESQQNNTYHPESESRTVKDWVVSAPSVKPPPPYPQNVSSPYPPQSPPCPPPHPSRNSGEEANLEFIKTVLMEEKKPCKAKKCKKPPSENMFGLDSSDMVLGLILIHQMMHGGSQPQPQPPCPCPPCYPYGYSGYPYPYQPSMMCYGNPYCNTQSCCQSMSSQTCCCQPMSPQPCCPSMCPQPCCPPMCPQPYCPPMCPQPCGPQMCPQTPAQMSAQAWQNAVFPESLHVTQNYRKVQQHLAKNALVNAQPAPESGIKLRFLDTDEDGGTTSADE